MKRYRIRSIFAASFVLALAAVLGSFVYSSRAANSGALMFVDGETTGSCSGRQVEAGFQGSRFSLELQQFWPNEPVYISFTFPDGRLLSPVVTSVSDPNSVQPSQFVQFVLNGTPLNGLDGVIDMPANFPWVRSVSPGGDYAYPFVVTNKWPYGCYTFTALGAFSNRQVQNTFAVIPRMGSGPAASPANLIVEDNTTGDPSSQQGGAVNIFGRGFIANELVSIWITAPDGVVFSFPYQPLTSDIGSFSAPFVFSANHPTGIYSFTALGTYSGFQVITQFNLTSRPSMPSGFGEIQSIFPSAVAGMVQVRGKQFFPSERIDLWMTLPDGAVRGLPSQFANEWGEFYADISLDPRLPDGQYDITAKGASSGYLSISTFMVSGVTSPNITQSPPDAFSSPFVTETNSGDPATLGPPPDQLPPFDTSVDPIFPDF